jgi:hypothetical protein
MEIPTDLSFDTSIPSNPRNPRQIPTDTSINRSSHANLKVKYLSNRAPSGWDLRTQGNPRQIPINPSTDELRLTDPRTRQMPRKDELRLTDLRTRQMPRKSSIVELRPINLRASSQLPTEPRITRKIPTTQASSSWDLSTRELQGKYL